MSTPDEIRIQVQLEKAVEVMRCAANLYRSARLSESEDDKIVNAVRAAQAMADLVFNHVEQLSDEL